MKKYSVIVWWFFITTQVVCQPTSNHAILDLPNVIPPSPTAASLGKFGEWPVSTYTGVTQIEIPIYTITAGQLYLPVSLQYHASGIKVEDIASWVGSGWALNAGGVITRSTVGLEDERPYGYIYTPSRYKGSTIATDLDVTNNLNDLSFFKYAVKGSYDTEPDIFYFNFTGGSGKFFLDENNHFRSATANTIKIVHDPITTHTPQGTENYWELVDENGVSYIFGSTSSNEDAQEYTKVLSSSTGMRNGTGEFKSAWYLKSLTSADNTDQIIFHYKEKSEWYESIPRQYFRWPAHMGYPRHWDKESEPYGFSSTQVEPDRITQAGTCILKDITWNQGKLVFTANTNRVDNITGGVLLDAINLIDQNGIILKTYSLLYDNNTLRPYLTELKTSGSSDELEKYRFKYYTGLPARSSNDQDHWGYFNNAGNSNLLPDGPLLNPDFFAYDYASAPHPSANREANALYAMAGSLESITYPTGGKTEFKYGINTYSKIGPDGLNPSGENFQTSQKGGGLRIESIKSYTQDGVLALKKDYKYDFPLSSGLLFNKPIYGNVSYQAYSYCCMVGDCWNDFHDIVNIAPVSQAILGVTQGSHVGYTQVEERINDGNGGKTVYEYRNEPDRFNNVTFDIAHFGEFGRPAFLQSTSNSYKNGQLLTKKIYKAGGTDPIQKIVNIYDNNDEPGDPNYYILPVLKIKSTGDSTLSCSGAAPGFYISLRKLSFAYGRYSLISAWPQLKTTIETEVDDNGNSLVTTTDYFYDNPNHLQPTKITTTNSKEEKVIISNKYPLDYTITGQATTDISRGIKILQDKHITVPVIEQYMQRSDANGTNVRTVSGVFSTYKPTVPYLSMKYQLETASPLTNYQASSITASSATKDSRYQPVLYFDKYDSKGNLLQLHKADDVNNSYIWGYNNALPTAKVANATGNEIYFTSFEEGGWDYNMQYDNAFAHAGKYSGRIVKTTAGESTSLSTTWLQPGLAAPKKFHYSGWIYSDGPSASIYLIMKRAGETAYHTYADQVSTTAINKWVYMEKDYTVPGDVATMALRVDNNGGGTVWFDDLRLHPSNAQMTTYTYTPLVGMTSQSDVTNRMTTYAYDGLGRLSLIKDQDGRILKKLQYGYQSPNPNNPVACSTSNCAGTDEKCVNGFCEKAKRINTSTVLVKTGENAGKWKCSYYYQWSDGSTSPPNALPADGSTPVRINEFNTIPCDITQ